MATFTNLAGDVFQDVRLVRADDDGIIYRFSEGVGGGGVFYTNLTAAGSWNRSGYPPTGKPTPRAVQRLL